MLKDEPNKHEEFVQKCSVHLAYAGRGIYIQLVPRVQSLHYEIFRVSEQDTEPKEDSKPVIVGCLTAQENETLDTLLNTGLGSPSTAVSASTGSEQDLPRVKRELHSSRITTHEAENKSVESSADASGSQLEPTLSIKCLSPMEIDALKSKPKSMSLKSKWKDQSKTVTPTERSSTKQKAKHKTKESTRRHSDCKRKYYYKCGVGRLHIYI